MANPNFDNRTLFHGDNLDFLRGMDSETVHLIATDPPFNKGKDFHATPDSLAAGAKFEDRWSWDRDVHQDWVDAIEDDWEATSWVIEAAKIAAGDDMAAYLCWLGVRLIEMHRVLREDGSLYLHIDHTAHAWVKALLDSIFGRKNFRNEIVWCYSGGGYHDGTFHASTTPFSATPRDSLGHSSLSASHTKKTHNRSENTARTPAAKTLTLIAELQSPTGGLTFKL